MNEDITSINTSDVCPKNDNDKKCAPGISFDAGSCIKLNILIEMAKAYNKENGSTPIKLHQNLEILNPRKYKKYLVSEFNKKLGKQCSSQKCWLEQSFISNMKVTAREELEKYTIRPDGPNGRFEWLNTININEVMEQYEKKNPNFKFIGAVPIDFDDFERFGIRNLDYSKLLSDGKSKLGFVFNLDEHDQPGSHWVALYSDLAKGEIYFFDSYGAKPERRIRTLMRRLANFCRIGSGVKSGKLKVNYNKIRHQYENSECGVYSINFIARMLRGDSFDDICGSKVPDKKINKCRNVYFNNVDIKA